MNKISPETIEDIADAIQAMGSGKMKARKMEFEWGLIYFVGALLRVDIKMEGPGSLETSGSV